MNLPLARQSRPIFIWIVADHVGVEERAVYQYNRTDKEDVPGIERPSVSVIESILVLHNVSIKRNLYQNYTLWSDTKDILTVKDRKPFI